MKSKWCSQEFCAQPQLQASLSQLVANFVPDDPLVSLATLRFAYSVSFNVTRQPYSL